MQVYFYFHNYMWQRICSGGSSVLGGDINPWEFSSDALQAAMARTHHANSYCALCQQWLHETAVCPFNVRDHDQTAKPATQGAGPPSSRFHTDRPGTYCVFFNGTNGCIKKPCNYTHRCSVCFAVSHGRPRCPSLTQG